MSFILQYKFGMQNSTPISFTNSALKELQLRIAKHQISAPIIRVGVKVVGAISNTYLLAFDQPTDSDKIYTISGLSVIVANKDLMFVLGLEIDFVKKGNEEGFVFNP